MLGIPTYGPFFPPDRLHEVVALARMAEDAGVDTVVVPDHVAMSDRTDRYRWGRFPLPLDAQPALFVEDLRNLFRTVR